MYILHGTILIVFVRNRFTFHPPLPEPGPCLAEQRLGDDQPDQEGDRHEGGVPQSAHSAHLGGRPADVERCPPARAQDDGDDGCER